MYQTVYPVYPMFPMFPMPPVNPHVPPYTPPVYMARNAGPGAAEPSAHGNAAHPALYKPTQEAISLIRQSVQSEREDELFYDYLISVAPSQEEKNIIASIRDDERNHNKMFRSIYRDLTGQEISAPQDVTFKKPESFTEGVKGALFGELAAMEKYRDIRAGLSSRYHRDMVFEILTDELKHAGKYNYILYLELNRKIKS